MITAGPIRHDRYRFCPACGAALQSHRLRPEEPPRLICSSCAGVVYLDPKVVACVILEIDEKILLMRRKRHDDADRWLLPGGYVDEGESVEHAAVRELWEETSLHVRLDGLVGVFSYPDWPPVIIVYHARMHGVMPHPGEETAALALFAPKELPWNQLAFTSTRDALRAYIQKRSSQSCLQTNLEHEPFLNTLHKD